MRSLVVVLGDQLDPEAAAFDGFDPLQDGVFMAEAPAEATAVWSSKARIALFLAAMRHFAAELRTAGRALEYVELADPGNRGTLAEQLRATLESARPTRILMTAPGEWRVLQAIKGVAAASGIPLEVREDRHFYCSVREFAAHAGRRTNLRLEAFYRQMRRRHRVLLEVDASAGGAAGAEVPAGGRWNFDSENRHGYGPTGPGAEVGRSVFAPDAITRAVLDLVDERFANHPGSLAEFAWPVTRSQARAALEEFIAVRLPHFGRYQDAMWAGEPWGHHSHLSAALNLKLLNPREVVAAAEAAYRQGRAPLAAVEGFIRQILGWREFVRGIYWTRMPGYADSNALGATQELPRWYWDAQIDMACLRDALEQTLRFGYAHHIQRLMVTGLYALLLGVRPQRVHEWYLAVYVDAVEWVELPNTLGMSQYADGGYMATKPYAASGKYIDRMSNLCRQCRFNPERREGPGACPFTTLYWDFLLRHAERLAANPRMALQIRNLARLSAEQRAAIAQRAAAIRAHDGRVPD